MSFAKASIAASTNSEIATPLAPRAHVTVRPSNSSAGSPSMPVPESWTHGTLRTHGAGEPGRRTVRGELDDLDVGKVAQHSLGGPGAQLVDHSHRHAPSLG